MSVVGVKRPWDLWARSKGWEAGASPGSAALRCGQVEARSSVVPAQAADATIRKHGLHPGVFSLIQGARRDVGTGLVTHQLIKAVGFTGSRPAAVRSSISASPVPSPFPSSANWVR